MTMEASAPRGSSVSDARLSKCSDVHRLSAGSPMSSTVEEDSPTVKPVPAVTPLAPLPVADPSAVLGVGGVESGSPRVSPRTPKDSTFEGTSEPKSPRTPPFEARKEGATQDAETCLGARGWTLGRMRGACVPDVRGG